ncbi:MAG: ribonuclease III [Thermomicrobiales bacterium]
MPVTEPGQDRVDVAEQRLGVAFQDPALLQLALIHSSLLNEPLDASEPRPEESNERLEFLGDAVLDLIVAEYLYQRYPEMPEGRLTVSRATLVRRETLARWAEQLALGDLLRVGRGEVQDGMVSQRILAGAFESVVGAIYLDQGLDRVRSFIDRFLDRDIDSLLSTTDLTNYKGVLQERLQQEDTLLPEYVVISQEGPDHERTFVIEARHRGIAIGVGEGRSKRAAEQAAARDAVRRMAECDRDSDMDDHRDDINTRDITTH